MKVRSYFFAAFVLFGIGILLANGQRVFAAGACTAVGADYACVKTSDVNDPTGSCVSGKCSGSSDVKCCKSSSFKSTSITKYAELQTGTTGTSSASPTSFGNPLKYNSVEQFLAGFLTTLQRIIAVIALVFIVIGALMYVTSAGDSGQVTKAKSTIYAAMIGLAIAVAAPSFLKEISVLLGWTPNEASVRNALTLTQIAMNVLNFLLAILGVIALVMLVVSGVFYTTAMGDSKQVDTAKNIAKYAIFGVIVALSSMVILQQIAKFFVN